MTINIYGRGSRLYVDGKEVAASEIKRGINYSKIPDKAERTTGYSFPSSAGRKPAAAPDAALKDASLFRSGSGFKLALQKGWVFRTYDSSGKFKQSVTLGNKGDSLNIHASGMKAHSRGYGKNMFASVGGKNIDLSRCEITEFKGLNNAVKTVIIDRTDKRAYLVEGPLDVYRRTAA